MYSKHGLHICKTDMVSIKLYSSQMDSTMEGNSNTICVYYKYSTMFKKGEKNLHGGKKMGESTHYSNIKFVFEM